MEKRYTAKVPMTLMKALHKLGMPYKVNTELEPDPFTGKIKKKKVLEPRTYGYVLDWLASKNLIVHIYSFPCWHRGADEHCTTEFDVTIHDEIAHEVASPDPMGSSFVKWDIAADYGIDKALEMMEEGK